MWCPLRTINSPTPLPKYYIPSPPSTMTPPYTKLHHVATSVATTVDTDTSPDVETTVDIDIAISIDSTVVATVIATAVGC